MIFPRCISEKLYGILLVAILIFSFFLNFWNLWNEGFSNEYYAAAVRSMLENPGIAVYNSFDAAGFVTVDKPPVGLWVQALSAAVFGFSGWSVALPQALAGVCSVGILYLIVSRSFGKPAGLVAAFALAVTPIFVAVSRNGTMDGQLILVILLAIYIALKAAEERSLPYLLLAVTLVGIGFNIKMIQAFIVLPAILAVYLIGANVPLRKKAGHLGVAVLVLLIVSLSWAVAMDLTPADERPYIDNSGDNSVFSLILDYNGINRLESGTGTSGTGNTGPTGTGLSDPLQPGTYGDSQPDPAGNATSMSAYPSGQQRSDGRQGSQTGGFAAGSATRDEGTAMSDSPGNGTPGTGGSGRSGPGNPGLFRLFESEVAGQLSWLIPFALIGLIAWYRRPGSLSVSGIMATGIAGRKGLTLCAMTLWLVPGLLYFTFTTGYWHAYYLATIAPPLAALVGTGAAAMYTGYFSDRKTGWLLVCAVFVTGITGTIILNYTAEWSGILTPIVLIGTLGATAALVWLRIRNRKTACGCVKIIAGCAIALLFIAPLVWSFTPLVYGDDGNQPVAGPQTSRQGGGGSLYSAPGAGSAGGTSVENLASYLVSHNTGETFIAAVQSSMSGGASLIIETGQPVMSLGGFNGNDRIISAADLPDLIRNRTVRYFLAQGSSAQSKGTTENAQTGPGSGGNSGIWAWVGENCTVIPSSEWAGSESRTESRYTLYDCAGSV